MSALSDAQAHLRKAREFLEAAEANLELGLLNAATSNAVTSGINSKDAICLKVTGTTGRTENHAEAIAELRRAGPLDSAKTLSVKLGRLLKFKNRSQYQALDVAQSGARDAVDLATALLDGATTIVNR